MKFKHLVLGLLLWLGLLAAGTWWAAGPMMWSWEAGPGATVEQAAAAFRLRLAPLPRSPITDYSQRVANEETETPEHFDPVEWGYRETRLRCVPVIVLWLGSGCLVHWLMGMIVKGQKDYT